MDVERIKFERTGGFAGMLIAAEFNLRDLPEDQARAISGLLNDLDFANLPENLMGESSMPDQFNYTITVEGKKGKHTVTTGDASAPAKLQELLQLLNQLARSHAGKN